MARSHWNNQGKRTSAVSIQIVCLFKTRQIETFKAELAEDELKSDEQLGIRLQKALAECRAKCDPSLNASRTTSKNNQALTPRVMSFVRTLSGRGVSRDQETMFIIKQTQFPSQIRACLPAVCRWFCL